MTDGPQERVERVGLLFVHGIGEQARFDHLKRSVAGLAELMTQAAPGSACSVVDRTAGWPHPPGVVDPAGVAPVGLSFRTGERRVLFDCHEVWWADLGGRSGLWDFLTFWVWGLGQWCAPIYKDLDAARLRPVGSKAEHDAERPPGVVLPRSVAGTAREPRARVQLVVASFATMLLGLTWVLVKRAFGAFLPAGSSPTLLVQYVGDVRNYEARAVPGDSALSDPGHPRRVGIRRRMVTEMVALGADPGIDRWYVLAHSLGTVVAYNGLTEIGHALPNYLPQDQWRRLPQALREDEGCRRRPSTDVPNMMPSRPLWLGDRDVINRPLLFERLRGVLTYGSPLEKFASLWPRIVATADDRSDGANPLGRCRWLNLRAPQDPIGDDLCRFTAEGTPELDGHVPTLEPRDTPAGVDYLVAHNRYLSPGEVFHRGPRAMQRRAVARWLLDDSGQVADDPTWGRWRQPLNLIVALVAIPALVLLAAAFWTTLAGGIALLVTGGADDFRWSGAFAAMVSAAWVIVDVTLAVLLFTGFWRWARESAFNRRGSEGSAHREPERAAYWRRVERLHGRQLAASMVLSLLALAAALLFLWFGVSLVANLLVPGITLLFVIVGILLQTGINAASDPKEAGEPASELRGEPRLASD